MSIIGIDIGSSTTKIIEYKNGIIINKQISTNTNSEEVLDNFIENNNIKNIEEIVLTGIGLDKIEVNKYGVPVKKVDEFKAIGVGGLNLSNRKEAIIVSIGTGTAFIRADGKDIKHLGGTGVGAGTLSNLCDRFVNTKSFEEILELSQKGDLSKIDLRISDRTDEEIETLPPDLTLANFGNLKEDASNADITLGILNMIFEVIGVMAAFISKNDTIKEIVLIGNIVTVPAVKDILRKIEKLHNIKFIIPENAQYGVAIGAIQSLGL